MKRYQQCRVSLEEEAQLCTLLMEESAPGYLLRYKDLSTYQQSQQEERLDMDSGVWAPAEIEAPVVRTRRMTLTARFMPLFKTAAVVAVVFSLGNAMQHSFLPDVKEVAATGTIGKQISAPSVALSGDMVVAHEKQIMDSLHCANKGKEIKE